MVLIRKTTDFSKIRDVRIEIFKHLQFSGDDKILTECHASWIYHQRISL